MGHMVEFTLDHVPTPASRPQFNRKTGSAYYPKAHAVYHAFLMNHLRDKPGLPTEWVVEVRFLFVMKPYKTSDHPTHRSDVDNLSKLPMDCMTQSGRYWSDDNLVAGLQAYKCFAEGGEEPHTKVKVTLIDGSPDVYARKAFHG